VHKTKSSCYHKTHALIVIITLLLHLIVLFILFFAYKQHVQREHEEEVWASTNPTPTTPPLQILLMDDTPLASTQQSVVATTPSLIDQQKEEQREEQILDTHIEEKPLKSIAVADAAIMQPPEDARVPEQMPKTEEAVQKAVQDEKPQVVVQKTPTLPKKPTESRAVQKPSVVVEPQKITQAKPYQPKPVAPAQSTQRRQATLPPRKSSQRLMASLAASFLHEARDEQDHEITIIGDPRRMPTADQIKHERYLARLQQCLHTSCITLMSHAPALTEWPGNPTIRMKLNRDGSISNLTLVKSSQNGALDRFFMMAFQDAGHSFPPLPSYFPRPFYMCNWTVVNQ
jgi:outer membrane biosynthesis protein TonB